MSTIDVLFTGLRAAESEIFLGKQRVNGLCRVALLMLPHTFRRYATTTAHGDPLEFCRNMVRERDYASYLSGQGCPSNLQDAFYALRAFAVRSPRCVPVPVPFSDTTD